jgi:predicted MFS family arabinose efflux permease
VDRAGIGTVISTCLIGWISDRSSFAPVLIVTRMVPLLATALMFLLVRKRTRLQS